MMGSDALLLVAGSRGRCYPHVVATLGVGLPYDRTLAKRLHSGWFEEPFVVKECPSLWGVAVCNRVIRYKTQFMRVRIPPGVPCSFFCRCSGFRYFTNASIRV